MVERRYLLDTDIVIAMLRDRTDKTGIRAHALRAGLSRCCLSDVSLAELASGASKMSTERGFHELAFVQSILSVVPFGGDDGLAAQTFGRLRADLERRGTPLDDMNLLIASTAIASGMTLVTHNVKHFGRIPELVTEDWVGEGRR